MFESLDKPVIRAFVESFSSAWGLDHPNECTRDLADRIAELLSAEAESASAHTPLPPAALAAPAGIVAEARALSDRGPVEMLRHGYRVLRALADHADALRERAERAERERDEWQELARREEAARLEAEDARRETEAAHGAARTRAERAEARWNDALAEGLRQREGYLAATERAERAEDVAKTRGEVLAAEREVRRLAEGRAAFLRGHCEALERVAEAARAFLATEKDDPALEQMLALWLAVESLDALPPAPATEAPDAL